jgi:hypothetical protein
MPSLEAKRTLVKSPPEIWAEVSDAGALARHLGEFGEIRITRTQPESLVEWEGEQASGCVRLEPSGWGTKVTLTAETPEGSTPEEVEGAPVMTRTSWWSRFRRRRAVQPVPELAPAEEVAPVQGPAPEPEPALDGERAQAALTNVLDTLGAAHHRPFSRP